MFKGPIMLKGREYPRAFIPFDNMRMYIQYAYSVIELYYFEGCMQ